MVRVTLLSLLVAGVLAANTAAATRTTAPSELTHVRVLVTDSAVKIARDRFTKGALTRYPRGSIVDFVIINRGTKPYQAELLLNGRPFRRAGSKVNARTPSLRPGARAHLEVNFYFRSKFTLQSLQNGTVLARAPIVVF